MLYDDLKTDSSASSLLKKQSGTSTDLLFDYSLSTDQRDRRLCQPQDTIHPFFQEVPIYSDQPHIKNGFSTSHYKELNEDIIGALKFRATAVTQ